MHSTPIVKRMAATLRDVTEDVEAPASDKDPLLENIGLSRQRRRPLVPEWERISRPEHRSSCKRADFFTLCSLLITLALCFEIFFEISSEAGFASAPLMKNGASYWPMTGDCWNPLHEKPCYNSLSALSALLR